jgi:hypothetical protein
VAVQTYADSNAALLKELQQRMDGQQPRLDVPAKEIEVSHKPE